jgi:hypothetical protein
MVVRMVEVVTALVWHICVLRAIRVCVERLCAAFTCAHNVAASVRHAWLSGPAVCAIRKKKNCNKSLPVTTLVARNATRLWWDVTNSAFSRCLQSDGRFILVRLVRIWLQSPGRFFTFDFMKAFYELCTVNVIYKVNATVNCIIFLPPPP